MIPIRYILGDATDPIGYGHKIIAHIVNSAGGWGRGFVLPLAKRYPPAEVSYREWHANKSGFVLGNVQFVDVGEGVTVANMLAQQGYGRAYGLPPIRYVELQECLVKVRERALAMNATVHAPRFGSGLAGGQWALIADMIKDELSSHDVAVFIYDLPGK